MLEYIKCDILNISLLKDIYLVFVSLEGQIYKVINFLNG